jgi:hydrogenase maturation protease
MGGAPAHARSLGRTPPPSFTLCMHGDRFELGEGLSEEARGRLEAAWGFVQGLVREPTVEAWRSAARGGARENAQPTG